MHRAGDLYCKLNVFHDRLDPASRRRSFVASPTNMQDTGYLGMKTKTRIGLNFFLVQTW